MSRLKRLADDVDLADPEAVRAALGIPFRTEEHERIRREDACRAPAWRDRWSLKAVTAMAGTSWYRTLPTGAGKLDVPQAFINPATSTGEPKFSYEAYRSVDCEGRERAEARVGFAGLPAFSCLTSETIQRLLPAATLEMATDGVHLHRYQGKRRNELSFNFRMGVACAISVDVRTPRDR